MTTTTTTTHEHQHRHVDDDADYRKLHEWLIGSLERIGDAPLFTTDTTGLFEGFLSRLHSSKRQHYNCRSCMRFIENFGGLVSIGETGLTHTPFWPTAHVGFFEDAMDYLYDRAVRARVTGVFLTPEPMLGVSSTRSAKAPGGSWHHMHARVPEAMRYRETPLKNASQAMAEKVEEYGMLCRGLADFPIDIVRKATALLTTGGLYRSEKCIGVAKWLLDLHEERAVMKNARARDHITWRAIATAPTGYAHVRSSMIGTLLEDLVAGKPFEDIKRSFDAKMAPTQYQRPQAAPTVGQIAAAETMIEKLGAAGALARRYARLEEVLPNAIWTPRAPKAAETGGVFGHLKPKAAQSARLELPEQVITWARFARDVLPTAEQIDYLVPHGYGPYFAFITAENADAPPILQWDNPDRRNPVSWYLYQAGSAPGHWNLTPGTQVPVDAITLQPSSWTSDSAHHGQGVYFILRGARDTLSAGAGSGLFPETLKSEFRAMRSVIEAHSRGKTLGGAEAASACGICLQQSSVWKTDRVFRVTNADTRATYRIDRWE